MTENRYNKPMPYGQKDMLVFFFFFAILKANKITFCSNEHIYIYYQVSDCVVLLDREQGGRENLEAYGINVRSLLTGKEYGHEQGFKFGSGTDL